MKIQKKYFLGGGGGSGRGVGSGGQGRCEQRSEFFVNLQKKIGGGGQVGGGVRGGGGVHRVDVNNDLKFL